MATTTLFHGDDDPVCYRDEMTDRDVVDVRHVEDGVDGPGRPTRSSASHGGVRFMLPFIGLGHPDACSERFCDPCDDPVALPHIDARQPKKGQSRE